MTIRRSCKGTLPTECNCAPQDSSNVEWSGDGSAGSPYVPEVNLAVSPGLLSSSPLGLKAVLPVRQIRPLRARVIRQTTTPIIAPAGHTVEFLDIVYDNSGFYDASLPTRLTAPIDGWYGFGCQVATFIFEGVPSYDWEVIIMLNGAILAPRSRAVDTTIAADALHQDALSAYHERFLTAGEYIETNVRLTFPGGTLGLPRGRSSIVQFMTFESD